MSGRTIVVVGSANMDLVVEGDALPRPGETLLGGSFGTYPGGKGANQAVAAARAGGEVAMVGRVGDDAFGARLRDGLAADGVAIDGLGTADGPTGIALIVTARGENMIVVAPGANAAVDPAAIDAAMDAIGEAAIVMCQLEIPIESVIRAAERARAAGAVMMLDPAPARALPARLLELVDWITPNEGEARTLLGLPETDALDPLSAARRLQAMGARNVLISLAEKGALLLAGEDAPVEIAAVRVEAVDSTAAGDAFNGAFAAALAEGRPPAEAARFAACAAAIAVTRRGAQPSMAVRAEIDAVERRHSGTDQGH